MAVYVKVIFPQRENGIVVVVVNNDWPFLSLKGITGASRHFTFARTHPTV